MTSLPGFAGVVFMHIIASAAAQTGEPAAKRSVVFDHGASDAARLLQRPSYVESIVVEGRDPDARKRKPLEQRFAEALLAPPASSVGLRALDTTPCMSMPSTWNTIGSSYAPLTGCPR